MNRKVIKIKTRRNIYYDLEESPFISKFEEFKFYFSSQFYQNKFNNELHDYINSETEKFKNKYNTSIDIKSILAFNLYRRIEKRGCYCIYAPNNLESLKHYIIKDTLNGYIQVKE